MCLYQNLIFQKRKDVTLLRYLWPFRLSIPIRLLVCMYSRWPINVRSGATELLLFTRYLMLFVLGTEAWNKISLDSGLKYSKATHRYAVKIFIYLAPVLKTSRWYIFHPFYLLISPVLWHECQRVFLPAAPQQGMLGDLIVWWALSSLILITMNSGRGHCAWWQFCKVPNQTHREIENWKMYACKIKKCSMSRYSAQILICIL